MNPAISRRRHAKALAARDPQSASTSCQTGCQQTNVGEAERQYSLLGGGILAAYGLTRGSFSGLALAALGGALLWRGYTGHCELYHALGYDSAAGQLRKASDAS